MQKTKKIWRVNKMKEEKIKKINEKIAELDWSDENIPEIMEGFFNNSLEALNLDNCSEKHLESLYDTLNCEGDD